MPKSVAASPNDDATRTRILDAAMQCFEQIGITKTSLIDVARVAKLSRGTLYRWFGDRQSLIDAVVEEGTRQHFEDAAAAMEKKPTLARQIGAYAEVAVQKALEHQSYSRLMEGDTNLMRLITSSGDDSIARSIRFLEPYVRAAKDRGEVGKTINVTEAAEWLARLLISIQSTPASMSFDVNDPRSVGRYVQRFAVTGLTGKG